jgi:4-hydroxythreonine-4-phosphate dehydrogenase
MDNMIKVGITHGDINGVGYEVILKTFENEEMLQICTPIIYGSPKVATYHKKAIGCQTNFVVKDSAANVAPNNLNIVNCFGEDDCKIDFGSATSEAGNIALCALEKAMEDYKKGAYDVLVTAPINKNTIQSDKFKFQGHTEYIEDRVGEGQKPLMILMKDNLRVALVTTHVPISELSTVITKELIKEKIAILHKSLKRDFAISAPRIAVLSLNPHCGDGGVIGNEENEVIIPAITEANSDKLICYGPYSADGFFGAETYKHFDAVLAMYHDQGLAPFKAIAMDGAVNYTAGLPIVRTSPGHGTAYDIAGKGCASEDSFRNAIYAAIDIARNRERYDEANAFPLKKQYYEKRDDSDKLRLDQVDDEA